LGTSQDLTVNPCLIPQCWFLVVHALPKPLPIPTIGRGNRSRKSQSHYVDLHPSWSQVVVHFEPVRIRVKSGTDWLRDVLNGPKDEVGMAPSAFIALAETRDFRFSVGAIGGIVHDREDHL